MNNKPNKESLLALPVRISPQTTCRVPCLGYDRSPMALRFRPLHPLFAAEASGLDLRRPLERETVREIESAMDQYAVLVWHDQPFSEAEQVAFARQLGPLDL